jgi:glycosyltransferase involved in cell wall biosynthesis
LSDHEPRVWVVSPFSDPSGPPSADRYRFICDELTARGASATLFVSSFDHARKCQRTFQSGPWRIVSVFEPGYSWHVSLRRILSHAVFDTLIVFYFLRELLRGGRPRAILSAVPHNGAACVAAVFAKVVGARFIVDVHDIWPESILGVTRLNVIMRVGYRVWKRLADVALVAADAVFAESRSYATRADSVRIPRGLKPARPIYLGGDLAYYASISRAETLPPPADATSFLVAYAGNLGFKYDLDCVVDAFSNFGKRHPEAVLLLLGAGEREEELGGRLARAGSRAWVSGRIPHPILLGYLKRAHVGLNAFRRGGNFAYSYKMNDYLLCGLPVVNSLPGEASALISENGLGQNYEAGDVASLVGALEQCHSRWQVDPDWNRNIAAFAARLLDRRVSYDDLFRECLD